MQTSSSLLCFPLVPFTASNFPNSIYSSRCVPKVLYASHHVQVQQMYLSLPQAPACLCYQVSHHSQCCCPLCRQHAAALPGYPCSVGHSQICPKTLLLRGGAMSPAAFHITYFMTDKSMNKSHCIFPTVGSSSLGAPAQWEQEHGTGQEGVSPHCTPLLCLGDGLGPASDGAFAGSHSEHRRLGQAELMWNREGMEVLSARAVGEVKTHACTCGNLASQRVGRGPRRCGGSKALSAEERGDQAWPKEGR